MISVQKEGEPPASSDKVEEFLKDSREEKIEVVDVFSGKKEECLLSTQKERGSLPERFSESDNDGQKVSVLVDIPSPEESVAGKILVDGVEEALLKGDVKKAWLALLADGKEEFLKEGSRTEALIKEDSRIISSTKKFFTTKTQIGTGKFPKETADSNMVAMVSCGFVPCISQWSPYHGAIYAITEAMAKMVASGGDYKKIRFLFQQCLDKTASEDVCLSSLFSLLLGAFDGQIGFGLSAMEQEEGKRGMCYHTDSQAALIAYAVYVAKEEEIITPQLKNVGNKLVCFRLETDAFEVPVYARAMEMFEEIHRLIQEGIIRSACASDTKGIAAAISKMALGHHLGIEIGGETDKKDLFKNSIGSIVAEVEADKINLIDCEYSLIGTIIEESVFEIEGVTIPLEEALECVMEGVEVYG